MRGWLGPVVPTVTEVSGNCDNSGHLSLWLGHQSADHEGNNALGWGNWQENAAEQSFFILKSGPPDGVTNGPKDA